MSDRRTPAHCSDDTINSMFDEVEIRTPISSSTPANRCCPSCKRFEKSPLAELCPRCALVAANRETAETERRRHAEAVRQELANRKENCK